MKRNFKYATLFTVLSLLAVGCQKETIDDPTNAQIQQSVAVRNVTYTVDGITMHAAIRGEQH